MSILNKSVSYYPSIKASTQGVEESLLKILQTSRHEVAISTLRNELDPVRQKEIKELLPCYTVAGVFSRRNANGIISLSGLAAIDLDNAEEYDLAILLSELKKLPYIAYSGLSCRGKRLFCIIPFLYPDKYAQHYERLVKSFDDMGFPMGDTCHKQISQPRFVSFNTPDTCFYNHEAKPYHLLTAGKTFFFTNPTKHKHYVGNKTQVRVEKYISEIIKCIDIAPSYNDWIKLGFAFAAEFGEVGRSYFHCVSQFHPQYDFDDTESKYTALLGSKDKEVGIGSFFFYCKQAGIVVGG